MNTFLPAFFLVHCIDPNTHAVTPQLLCSSAIVRGWADTYRDQNNELQPCTVLLCLDGRMTILEPFGLVCAALSGFTPAAAAQAAAVRTAPPPAGDLNAAAPK